MADPHLLRVIRRHVSPALTIATRLEHLSLQNALPLGVSPDNNIPQQHSAAPQCMFPLPYWKSHSSQ